jgi:sugar phosphate isomerase/epimerase
MEQTAPHASYIRAKTYKVDSGREEWLDYERIIKILTNVNFNGVMSVVHEGGVVNDCDDKTSIRLAAEHLRELLRNVD